MNVVRVCAPLLFSTNSRKVRHDLVTDSTKVTGVHDTKKVQSGYGDEKDTSFLICHTDTVNIFQQCHFEKKHREELIRPNHSTITEQVHHLG